MINAPKKFEQAIGTVTRNIPSPIEAGTTFAVEGIGQKTFGCKLRSLDIPTSWSNATDIKLSKNTYGNLEEVLIKNVDLYIRQHFANRNLCIRLCKMSDITDTGPNGGFGGTIGVEELNTIIGVALPKAKTFWQRTFRARCHQSQRGG